MTIPKVASRGATPLLDAPFATVERAESQAQKRVVLLRWKCEGDRRPREKVGNGGRDIQTFSKHATLYKVRARYNAERFSARR